MQVQATRSVPQIEGGNNLATPIGDADLFNEILGSLQDGEQPTLEDDELLQSQMMAEHMGLLQPMPLIPTLLSIEEQGVNSPLQIELTVHEQPEVTQMEPRNISMLVDKTFQGVPEPIEPIESEAKVEVTPSEQTHVTNIDDDTMFEEKPSPVLSRNTSISFEEVNENQEHSLDHLESIRATEFNQTISQVLSEPHHEVVVQETSQSVNDTMWTNQSEVVAALEHQLLIIRENETTTLNLKLYPQHLGAIHVELNMKNGIVHANLLLDHVEAKPLIEQAFTDMNFDGAAFKSINVQINNQSKDQREQSESETQQAYTEVQAQTEDNPQPITTRVNTGILNLKV